MPLGITHCFYLPLFQPVGSRRRRAGIVRFPSTNRWPVPLTCLAHIHRIAPVGAGEGIPMIQTHTTHQPHVPYTYKPAATSTSLRKTLHPRPRSSRSNFGCSPGCPCPSTAPARPDQTINAMSPHILFSSPPIAIQCTSLHPPIG